MQTKTRVLVLILLPVVLSLVTVTGLVWTQKEIRREERLERITDEIVRGVFELNQVVSQDLLYQEERPKVQFRSIYASLKNTLARFPTETGPERVSIRNMIEDQEDIGFLFPMIIGGEGKQVDALGDRFYQEYKGQVTSLLLIKMKEIVSDSFQLMKSSRDRINIEVQRVNRIMIAVILVGGLAMMLLAAFIGRTILQNTRDLQREINDRRQAEKALRQSREDLDRAQQVGQIGSWRLDVRRNVLTWSDENYRIFGLSRGSRLTYETFLGTVHPDDRQYVDTRWQEGLRGAPYDVEHRLVVDGQEKWVREKAYLEFDEAGELLGGFGITQDITERKRSEQELREREERLRTSLGEKEVLLKEIHHRVKNNLQVISSLVSLQGEEVGEPVPRAIFQDLTHRVRSMALVHEKLYQSPDMARVEFAEYARSLLNYLWRAYGTEDSGVRLTLDLEPVMLSVNTAVPFGLILNELVGNALKHAFRGRAEGEVIVSLRGGAPDRVRLSVGDNGTGLPAGFDWRQARSLGLRLVQMLAGQLHAAVEVSSAEGTEFTITLEGPKL